MEVNNQDSPLNSIASKLGRRSFMVGAGISGIGLAGARLGLFDNMPGAAAFGMASAKAEAAAYTDADILNFALNLEYLEAEFYTAATTGKTLEESGFDVSGKGKSGPTTGAREVNFSSDGSSSEISKQLAKVAAEICKDEQDHVKLLRSALGSAAIAKPAINLNALGVGLGSFRQFLDLARSFEDVGISAYGGAAPLISSKSTLGTAAQILATEGLHAGTLRFLVSLNYIDSPAVDKYDVPPPPTGTKYFTVDNNALAIIRTPQQVLNIVYGKTGTGVDSGGFFPEGVNGYFTTT